MPQLIINLNDEFDCQEAVIFLQRRLEGTACDGRGGRGPKRGPKRRHRADGDESVAHSGGDVASLPLPQKLKRIQSRGMWKHLLQIARNVDELLSLPELDEQLDLPKNKMRSLKAIMAKLENRFDLQFLKVDASAGE